MCRLDSESALLVMSMLSELAGKGKTVVAVIHQPSYKIFRLVDHIMVLKKGGRIAVNGPGLNQAEGGANIQERVARVNRAFVECLPREWTEQRVSNGEFEFLEAGENIADWLLEKVEKEGDDRTMVAVVGPYSEEERMRRLGEVRERRPEVPARQLSSKWYQLWVFGKQSVVLVVRKPMTQAMTFFLVCVAGVLLGVIFDSERYVGPVGEAKEVAKG